MQALFYLLSLPISEVIIAFFAGFFTKIADETNKIIYGMVYAILLAINIYFAPFSSLFVGAILAQIIAKKIDSKAHYVGLLSLTPILFVPINLAESLFFLVFAYLDELFESGMPGLRPFLPLASLIFSILKNNPYYFLGLILFDTGYIIASYLFKRFSNLS